MSNFAALIATIQANIKTNGNEEITGAVLQDVLEAMVYALGTEAINNLESALSDEETARQNADGTLQDNIDEETLRAGMEEAALGNAIGAIEDAIEDGYVYAGIATPSGTPASGKVFYLAVTAGTYTNYGALVVTQGINILKNNGTAWSQEQLIALDNTPAPSSSGLVKSGGVFEEIMTNGSAFDLTVHNSGTTYADLSAALTAMDTLPAAYKKGGMSIKFVQTSDNKYVQYRLMSDSFNTTVANWQGVDETPTAGSENLVKSGGMVNSSLFGKINYNLKWTKIEKTAGLYNYPLLSNIVGNTYFYVYLKSNDVPSLLGVTFKNGITTTLQSDVIKLENVDISGGALYKIMLRPQNVDINYASLYTDSAWEGEMCIFQDPEMNLNTICRNSTTPLFKCAEKIEALKCLVPYTEITGYQYGRYVPITNLNIKAGDKLVFILNSSDVNREVEISLYNGDVKKETVTEYSTSKYPFNIVRYVAKNDINGIGYYSESTISTGIIVYREEVDKRDVVLYDSVVDLPASTLTELDLNEVVPKNQRCVLVVQGDVTSGTLLFGVRDSQDNKTLPDIVDVGNYNFHVGKECELVSSIDFDKLRVFSNTSIKINVRLYYIKENNNDIALKHLESSNNSVSKDFSNLVALTPYKEFQLQSRAIPIIENGLSINEGDELIFVVDSKPDDRRILFTLMDGNDAVAIDFIGCNTMDGGTQVLHVKAPASGNAIRAYTESSQIFGLQILKTGVTEKMQFVAQNLSFSTAAGVKNLSTGLNIKAGDVLHFFVKSSNTTPLIYFGLKDSTETVSADFLKIENTDLSNEVEYTVTMQGYGSILYVYSTAINTISIRIFKEKNINEEVNVGKFFNSPSSLFLMADFNWPLSLRINASNDGKRWKLLKEFTDLQYRDPWIGKYNGEYYFVGTPANSGSGSWSGSMTLTIYKSTDLNTWSQYCQITLSQSSLWSGYDDASIVWAPEIKWFDGVPYLLCALYFPKTGGGYRVQPYIYQLASDLQSVINGQRLAGTNIDDTYDFDVDITKIGDYYYEISNGHRGRCINIGRSSTLYGNYDTYAYIELQNGGDDLYWEGGTIVPVGEKIYIFVTQKYPGWVSGQPKALGLYVCDNNFKLLEYHKMTGGAMSSEDDMILAEHPFVFMADINDLFTILNL